MHTLISLELGMYFCQGYQRQFPVYICRWMDLGSFRCSVIFMYYSLWRVFFAHKLRDKILR